MPRSKPKIDDPYGYVLGEMARGCAVQTIDLGLRGRTATLGREKIPVELVDALERRGLIRCREAWHKNWEQGKLCDYELTPKGRAQIEV